MSTQYTILEKGQMLVELDESSNRFSFSFTMKEETTFYGSFEPEEVVGMALEMLNVVSYWMTSDELRAAVQAHVCAHGSKDNYVGQLADDIFTGMRTSR